MAVLTTQEKTAVNRGHLRSKYLVGDRISKLDTDGTYTGSIADTSLTAINSNTLTIDNDNTTGKLKFQVTTGGTNHTVTVTNSTTTAARTITLPDATDTLVGKDTTDTLTNKTIDGDANTVQDLGVGAPKAQATVGNAKVAIPFTVVFAPSGAGNYNYTVPSGKTLRVLDAVGYKTVGAGAHADDELTLSNNGAGDIYAKKELNGVSDGDRFTFATFDDSQRDVTAGNVLRLVASENEAGGCDSIVIVTCVWT